MHDADNSFDDSEHRRLFPQREHVIIYRDFQGINHEKTVWVRYPDDVPTVEVEKQHPKFRYWKIYTREAWDTLENLE